MKHFLAIVFLVLIGPTNARADDFSSLDEAKTFIDDVFLLFNNEEFDNAYNALKPYWPVNPVEIDNMANQMHTQWPTIRQRFGAIIGSEFVVLDNGGASFARFIYIQKFQNHALRWEFVLYKPSDRWLINGVSFDDQISLLFP